MNINTEQILQEIDKVGQYLAEKLQVPVEKAYEILMRQVWFEFSWAMVWVLFGIILFIVGTVLFIKAEKWFQGDKCSQRDFDAGYGIHFFILLMNLFGCIIFFAKLYTVLQIAINPEWHMIQMIMEKLQ